MTLPFTLPDRPLKPRASGLTCLIDPGLPTGYFRDVIESHGGLVDCVKFGWGTSLVTKDLAEKMAVLRANDVTFLFGGSLFEKAVQRDCVDDYFRFCVESNCPLVEISNGTLEMAQEEKCRHITRFAQQFTVWSEVGYKDGERSINLPPYKWIEFMLSELAAGAQMVITESRESGTSGICRSDGEVRYGLISEIIASPVDMGRVIFEAPNKELQTYFVKKLGSNVNLANIPFSDVIGLETLRLGLRSDTLIAFE
ncbi:MAG: comA [Chthoniobacteraceae bacterium]|nr:comA [Chthoniobacteraceae bacterium]MDB6174854.1 comA [Chthoniobacteraceae bacterium]